MVVELAAEHQKLVEEIAKKNGFENFTIEAEPGSEKGDGYSGQMVRITIKNDTKELKIVLKLAHQLENSFIRAVYLKEIYMYSTVFDAFNQFQEDNGLLNGFNYHAKLYGICKEKGREALAMENLIESGLKLWNRRVPMNSKHVSIVLKEYGKMHAVSFAMREKNPELLDNLIKGLTENDNSASDNKTFMEQIATEIRESIPRIAKDDVEVQKGMQRAVDLAEKTMAPDFSQNYNVVITHGDCWCNNMLFKYEDPNDETNPTKVCLIDFQLSRFTTPVADLSYFLGTNSPKEILYDYEKYLKIYHNSLSESLKAMNCDAEVLFPFSKLMEHWKIFALQMCYIAPILFKVLTVDKENAIDLRETKTEDILRKFCEGQDSVADERTYDVFKFLVDNELL